MNFQSICRFSLARNIAPLKENLNIRFLNKLLSRCVFTGIGKARLETVDAILSGFLLYDEKFIM